MSHALVFAATGAIASGVAHALAQRGHTLWLAGLDERVDALADALRPTGASIHTVYNDALDPVAVREVCARIQREAGGLDVVFNGIGGPPKSLGYPKRAVDHTADSFLLPLRRIVGSQFLTAIEASRVLRPGGSIVLLSATLSVMTAPNMANISAACGAIEALTRSLAGELGPRGIRVNCVRGSAMPETRTIQRTFAGQTALLGEPMPMSPPPLGRPTTVEDTSRAVAFLASPDAAGITGQVLTVCGGQFVGQG